MPDTNHSNTRSLNNNNNNNSSSNNNSNDNPLTTTQTSPSSTPSPATSNPHVVTMTGRNGIRNRMNRFSDSVFNILSSSRTDGTVKPRTSFSSLSFSSLSASNSSSSTSSSSSSSSSSVFSSKIEIISRIVVSLFLLSFFFIVISVTFHFFQPFFTYVMNETVQRSHNRYVVPVLSTTTNSMSSSSMSVLNYHLVLVNESKPFNAAPHIQVFGASADSSSSTSNRVDSEDDEDEGTFSTMYNAYSEDEVYRVRLKSDGNNDETKNIVEMKEDITDINGKDEGKLNVILNNKMNNKEDKRKENDELDKSKSSKDIKKDKNDKNSMKTVDEKSSQERKQNIQETKESGKSQQRVSGDKNNEQPNPIHNYEIRDDETEETNGINDDKIMNNKSSVTKKTTKNNINASSSNGTSYVNMNVTSFLNMNNAVNMNIKPLPVARLIVLTMDRARSLSRLLESLLSADYNDDVIDLDIWIDRHDNAKSIDMEVLKVSRNVTWKYGTKTIHKRTSNAGLYQQWMYTWNVTHDPADLVVILEDDLQVSSSFYQWLCLARRSYLSDPQVGAFTLQRHTLRPKQRKGFASGPLNLTNAEHPIYKYRLLGTWGFAPVRSKWKEFINWFELVREKGDKPYVDGLVTTEWYKKQEKDGFAPNMWSQWWIKFVDEKNYFTVTANLPQNSTLAANWRESGLHYDNKKPSTDFPLFNDSVDQFVMLKQPALIDWDGLVIPSGKIH